MLNIDLNVTGIYSERPNNAVGRPVMSEMVDVDLESAKVRPAECDELGPKTTQTCDHVRSTAYLDGLRGLAALLVYFSHNVPWWYGFEGGLEHGFGYHGEHMLATFPFVRSLFSGGAAAVAIFFVMSGYVLSIAPLRMLREGRTRDLRRHLVAALIKRPFRLFIPVTAISLVFALVMQLPFGLAPHLEWPKPEPTLFSELLRWTRELGWTVNPLVEHGQFTHWFCYDPPAWTMAAELRGSILVFNLLAVLSCIDVKWWIYACGFTGLFMLAVYQWELACFSFGIVLAINDFEKLGQKILASRLSIRCQHIFYHFVFFSGWYILGQPHGVREPERSYGTPGWYFMTKILPRIYYNHEYWRFWNTIGATMLIYSIMNIKWIQSFLLWPSLRYLGKISFSLYLIHIPIAWTVGDRICRLLGVIRQDFTTAYDGLLAFPDLGPPGFSTGLLLWQAFVLPLNLLLASWAAKRIDKPSVAVGKWIVARIGLARD